MMESRLAREWMWSDAFELLDRAERLRREVFRPARSDSRPPAWEPPVDVLETRDEVIVFVALPGVPADRVEVSLDGDALVFSGTRSFPEALDRAIIHRLELPQGRFERRVPLPPGRYSAARRSLSEGCLTIVLEKLGASGG